MVDFNRSHPTRPFDLQDLRPKKPGRGVKRRFRGLWQRHSPGFTLMEVMVTLILIALAIVPMIDAFTPFSRGAEAGRQLTVYANQARGTLYRTADLDFAVLNAKRGSGVALETLFGSVAEADNERFDYLNQTISPVIDIADASSGSGGLLEVTVTVGTVSLKTLVAEY